MFHTHVSLSSHERHVSFTVPCKTEADGGVSVRNLCRKKREKLWLGRVSHVPARACCQPPSHISCNTYTKLKTAPYQLQTLITAPDFPSSPTGCLVRLLIFAGFQLTRVQVNVSKMSGSVYCSEQTARGGLMCHCQAPPDWATLRDLHCGGEGTQSQRGRTVAPGWV